MGVIADVKLPDIEMPDMSRIDLPKVDIEKARKSASKATSRATSSVKDAVAGMPRRNSSNDAASKAAVALPLMLAGIVAGIGVGYILGTSEWFTQTVRDLVDQARARMQGGPSGLNRLDDLGDEVEVEFTAVGTDMTDVLPETDFAADTDGNGRPVFREPIGAEQMGTEPGPSGDEGTYAV